MITYLRFSPQLKTPTHLRFKSTQRCTNLSTPSPPVWRRLLRVTLSSPCLGRVWLCRGDCLQPGQRRDPGTWTVRDWGWRASTRGSLKMTEMKTSRMWRKNQPEHSCSFVGRAYRPFISELRGFHTPNTTIRDQSGRCMSCSVDYEVWSLHTWVLHTWNY